MQRPREPLVLTGAFAKPLDVSSCVSVDRAAGEPSELPVGHTRSQHGDGRSPVSTADF
jgi:hypothetical protein